MSSTYIIQLGKDQGKYETKHIFKNRVQAYRWYNSYNIHSGGKKRLLENGKVVERYIS